MARGLRFWTPILDFKMLKNCSRMNPKMHQKSHNKSQKLIIFASRSSSGAFRDPQVPRGSLQSQFWTSRSPPGINFGAPGANFRTSGTHVGAPGTNFPAFGSRSRLQKHCKQRCGRIHSRAFVPQSPHCIAKSHAR